MGQKAFKESKEAILKNLNRVLGEEFTWLLKSNHKIGQAWQPIRNLQEEYPEEDFNVNILMPCAREISGNSSDSDAYERLAGFISRKNHQEIFSSWDKKLLRSFKISPE